MLLEGPETPTEWLVQHGSPAVQQVYPDLTWEGAGDTSKKSFIHQTSVVKPFSNHEWYIQCCQRFPSDAQTVDWLVWTNIHHPLWSANELQASSLLVRFPNPLATSKSKWVREPDLDRPQSHSCKNKLTTTSCQCQLVEKAYKTSLNSSCKSLATILSLRDGRVWGRGGVARKWSGKFESWVAVGWCGADLLSLSHHDFQFRIFLNDGFA